MPERQYSSLFQGKEVDVSEVPTVEISEKLSTYVLEDGMRLTVLPVVTNVMRVLNNTEQRR